MSNNRKKILFVLPDARGGGSEKVALTLIKNWNRDVWDIHVAMIEKTGPLLNEIPDDVQFHDLNSTRIRNAILPLYRLIRKLDPWIVFSPLAYVNIAVLLLKPLFPQVKFWIREANDPVLSHGMVMRCFCKIFYRLADAVICQSQTMAKLVLKLGGIDARKIRVIANPVMINGKKSSCRDSQKIMMDDSKRIMAAGRLCRQKGFDLLIDALGKLIAKGVKLKLLLLGEGEEKSALVQQAKKLGIEEYISFEGYRSDMHDYFENADVFVSSSRWEGMPNAVLEALAFGLPVVSTRVGAVPDMAEDFSNLLLCRTNDPDDLADKIIHAMSMTIARSAENLPDKYRIATVISAYEKLECEHA